MSNGQRGLADLIEWEFTRSIKGQPFRYGQAGMQYYKQRLLQIESFPPTGEPIKISKFEFDISRTFGDR